MALRHEDSRTPLLDEWIAEVGEKGVVAAIEDTKRQIAEGSVRGFHDRESYLAFLEYLRGRPQSA